MDRGDDVDNQVVGGPAPHVPVMLNEVLKTLNPASGDIILDGTFGAGGYTQSILQQGARVIALDRDPNAIRDGSDLVRSSKGMLILKEGEFGELDHHVAECGYDALDGVVLDIGVSSMQLDQADRGFSFQSDGPLDMRMAQHGVSAADVINLAKQSDLTRIIGILGEERNASQVSRAIVRQRAQMPFSTTKQLSAVVEKVLPRKAKDRIHPATRTFQALRMFVNQELWQLADALCAAEKVLQKGGRLVVVTFHSLEDRLVKLFFRDRMGGTGGSRHLPEAQAPTSTFHASGKSLLKPTPEEIEVNARARSAKLRWGIRTAEPARPINASLFGLPNLVSLDQFALKGDGHAL